jgi:hypothetical protein
MHAMLAARGNAIVITNFCHLAAKFIYLRFDKDHTKSQTALNREKPAPRKKPAPLQVAS